MAFCFLQDSQSEMKIELDELKKRCGDQSNLLRELESQLDQLDRERLQQVGVVWCICVTRNRKIHQIYIKLHVINK